MEISEIFSRSNLVKIDGKVFKTDTISLVELTDYIEKAGKNVTINNENNEMFVTTDYGSSWKCLNKL